MTVGMSIQITTQGWVSNTHKAEEFVRVVWQATVQDKVDESLVALILLRFAHEDLMACLGAEPVCSALELDWSADGRLFGGLEHAWLMAEVADRYQTGDLNVLAFRDVAPEVTYQFLPFWVLLF